MHSAQQQKMMKRKIYCPHHCLKLLLLSDKPHITFSLFFGCFYMWWKNFMYFTVDRLSFIMDADDHHYFIIFRLKGGFMLVLEGNLW